MQKALVTGNNGKLRSFVLCSVRRSMNEKELLRQRSAIFALQQGTLGKICRFVAPIFEPEAFSEVNVCIEEGICDIVGILLHSSQ